MSMVQRTDLLVVGGGFFGTFLACMAARAGHRVRLLEMQGALMQAASLVNQARIHNGYHYPRSILTGIRSRENYERFAKEFPRAVVSDFTHLYAIARNGSHVTAQQFALFCDRIGAEHRLPAERFRKMFDTDRIEAAFEVKEHAFDADELRAAMIRELGVANVEVQLNTMVHRVEAHGAEGCRVHFGKDAHVDARLVLLCPYARLNELLLSCDAPAIPMNQELVEIALVEPPSELAEAGWTIMDGPFCSSLPFPTARARSLYHVRYSVHATWQEGEGLPTPPDQDMLLRTLPRTNVQHMLHNCALYVPAVREATYVGSRWIVRSKLPGSARTDSRPILFRPVGNLPGCFAVLGGKLDNVYDVQPYLLEAMARAFSA